MIQTYQALINDKGIVKILDDIEIDNPKRALVIVFDDTYEESFYEKSLPYILSQRSLEKDWNRPEEDEAWAYLQ